MSNSLPAPHPAWNDLLEKRDALEILSRDTGSTPIPDSMETLRGTLQKLRNQLLGH